MKLRKQADTVLVRKMKRWTAFQDIIHWAFRNWLVEKAGSTEVHWRSYEPGFHERGERAIHGTSATFGAGEGICETTCGGLCMGSEALMHIQFVFSQKANTLKES